MLNLLLILAIVIATGHLICNVTGWLEEDYADHRAYVVSTFTYRDNLGRLYLVTATSLEDAHAILAERYGQAVSSSFRLTEYKEVF